MCFLQSDDAAALGHSVILYAHTTALSKISGENTGWNLMALLRTLMLNSADWFCFEVIFMAIFYHNKQWQVWWPVGHRVEGNTITLYFGPSSYSAADVAVLKTGENVMKMIINMDAMSMHCLQIHSTVLCTYCFDDL